MNYFFTSDLHLGHANIIKYCGRTQFMTAHDLMVYNVVKNKSRAEQKKFRVSDKSLYNMNEGIVKRWNERVKPEDTIFCIGDFCFKGGKEGGLNKAKYWESKLNGKIIFIKGNHDKNNSTKTIIERLVIGYGGKRICLVHNPEHVREGYEIHFVGHIHNNWTCKRVKYDWRFTDLVNVGVDVWNFYPVKFDELMKRYHSWKKTV